MNDSKHVLIGGVGGFGRSTTRHAVRFEAAEARSE